MTPTWTVLLATLVTACATDDARTYLGSTEDDRAVEIRIDGDFMTAEIGTEQFAGELAVDAFDLKAESGTKIDGIVVELIVGAVTSPNGDQILFTATEDTGYGQVSQADYTTFNTGSTASYCVCNTTYYRVYCRRTDGSWYWTGSYC
jgi:hypothetical protein